MADSCRAPRRPHCGEGVPSYRELEEFLDSTQSLPGPFSYVILGPDYETDEVDFFWGNFYQSEEARQAFEAEWQNLNPEVEDNWNMVSDCLEPRYYNSAEVPTS